MANNWTDEQKAAFTLNDSNILVAAAAGSGKTAVLVERIIKKITDAQNPVNVDELVVVTFTKAAAAEMKQRIREAIDALVEEQPDNMHLVNQLTLINNAQISTIDSFCLGIIRNHFTEVELDPSFRTADEGEIKLLENDVMEDMLEEYYASGNEEFFTFVDSYGTGRDDSAIEDMILKVYRFARSNPWPEQWYDMCVLPYSDADMEESQAVKFLYKNIKNVLTDYERLYTGLAEICREPQGPLMYVEAIESDLAGIRQLLNADSFAELGRRVRLISFDALGRKKVPDVSEQKKKYVKDMRDGYKKYVTETLLSKIFVSDVKQIAADLADSKAAVFMLTQLAKDFAQRMQKEKRQRNMIDFNDMEHLALNILVSYENGKKTYTDVAKTLANKYHEIMIDEYQDSNLLQEEILTAVSKSVNGGGNNIYMVGDVKQSIYKFRLACPELFIDKYDRYQSYKYGDGSDLKIELQMNFRSRRNVLESTNDVFRRVMNKEFCGIRYDDAARLNNGFPYPQTDAPTEVILIDTKETSAKDARETEGAYIASKIKELMKDGQVYDAKRAEYRRMKYSDIVILTRSVKDWADVFVNELMNVGIPAYCESNAGYFATFEIKTLMNLLSVIDNPTKDIEMSGVMLSYFGGFTVDDVARVRMISNREPLIYQLRKAAECDEPGELNSKAKVFVDKLDALRRKSEYVSIQELVWKVVFDTGYYDYVGTMPAGKQRQANVDLLLSRAGSFENTSYSGLFNFLRYVERMKKSEVDYGEASVLGENEELVRVMSIHKSKGLEFPVVFVAGMHKKMNFMDANGSIVIDGDLGIGMDVVRLSQRTKGKTVIKASIARKIVQDTIAEEQRVLYVAMTRARERLIMTGVDKDAEKAVKKWTDKAEELHMADEFSYLDNENFKTYFDMVMPVALLSEDRNLGVFRVNVVENEQAVESEQPVDDMSVEDLPEDTKEIIDDTSDAGHMYPAYGYATQINRKLKITVSELKQMQHDADYDAKQMMEGSLSKALADADKDEQAVEEVKAEAVPVFIAGKKEKLAGNERGTAYHRVMECLDYEHVSTIEEIERDIDKMAKDERMTRMQADCVDAADIYRFCQSELGHRISKAMQAGLVRREQPFVFRPVMIDQLVQGVIDLYFEEEDGLVIVDYKTDRVKRGAAGEEQLRERYMVQLDYYAKALEQLTGKKVKGKVIYSFALGKVIYI